MPQLVLAFILGACVASFLNVVADRFPQGQSIVRPPSHCPSCGRRLTPWELVPVVSYIVLRGRCYACKSRIPIRSVLVEAGLGGAAAYIVWCEDFSVAALVLFAYLCFFLLVSLIDLDHTILPHRLVLPALLVTLALAPWWNQLGIERSFLGSEAALPVFLGSLLGGLALGGLYLVLLLVNPRWIGGGDPPLAALVGLVAGIPGTLVAFMAASVSGGLVGAALLVLRRKGRKDAIPFGPFLALGGTLALLWGDSLWRWYAGLLTGG